jgi:hypothetical protein
MRRYIALTLFFGCCLLQLMNMSIAAAVPQLINYQVE